MSKFVFLILHYYTYEETVECVESIRNLKYEEKEIVIVDNNSKNESGKMLKEKYKDENWIHIILNDENLGFANGNNAGFEYIKENLNADYIVMCNNDVYMIQDNFCEKIIEEYEASGFAILGPRILMPNNKICDYNDKMPTLKQLKKKKTFTTIFYYLNKMHLRYIYSIIYRIVMLFKKEQLVDTSIRKEDVVLHGCCIIFSKKYIDKFDGIDKRTFLYYEEPLLYLRIKKNNMKSVYNPYIMIFHNEGVSTKKSIKNKRKKFDFKLKNELESLKILISDLEEQEKSIS